VSPKHLGDLLVMLAGPLFSACASAPKPAAPTPVPRTPAQRAPPPMPTPTITERVPLGDVTTYYASYGTGKPLILLHGGMGSADAFAWQVPVFAQQYRVITPDSRGQGRSTDSDAPLTYHAMAEDVVRLMDYLKIDRAYIVGWSDGGNTALDMAINHPDRVAALVAFGAVASPGGLEPGFVSYLENSPAEVLERDFGDEYLRLSSTPEHLPVLAQKVKKMLLTEPNFTAEQLGSITTPAAIVDGAQEQFITAQHVEEIAKAIPNAKLIWIPAADHYAPAQMPDEFNKIVLDFLKDK
jgi:pimeloyl-ACP methyl ester carboxylesterase